MTMAHVTLDLQKMVLKWVTEDEKSKRKVMKAVAGVEGVESVAVDMKEKKITVIGEADPVFLTVKLRKFGFTELLSVGPAKEEKKAEGEKKEGAKKEEKKAGPPTVVYMNPSSYAPYPYTVVADEYNPNTCTIC